MNPMFYNAAADGKINPFKDYRGHLNSLLTPNQNTILHIHLSSAKLEFEFVNQLLDLCPSLVSQPNIKNETPLHLAARYGHSTVVDLLIQYKKDIERGEMAAKFMLRMTNEEGDTALHEAARNNHVNVVKLLTKEDIGFPYPENGSGETPLYIAAYDGYSDIVSDILESGTSYLSAGPGGKTALHAAVISCDEETITTLLEKTQNLTSEVDQHGWSPLLYAAYLGLPSISRLLVESNPLSAYIADKDKKTALHIAAIKDGREIMRQIVSHCPDCCELVDNRGFNALHYASNSYELFTHCLENSTLCKLINEKDPRGNTPLHIYAAYHAFVPDFIGKIHEAILHARNQQNQNFFDILFGSCESKEEILKTVKDASCGLLGGRELNMRVDSKKIMKVDIETMNKHMNERLEKASPSHLVVVALIATVTFAAAFTLPSGFQSEKGPDQGKAILAGKICFRAIVVSNAIALMLSLAAVSLHFLKARPWKSDSTIPLLERAFHITVLSILAVVFAFITAMVTVLGTSLGLTICACSIFIFFLLVFLIVRRSSTRNILFKSILDYFKPACSYLWRRDNP